MAINYMVTYRIAVGDRDIGEGAAQMSWDHALNNEDLPTLQQVVLDRWAALSHEKLIMNYSGDPAKLSQILSQFHQDIQIATVDIIGCIREDS